MPTRPRSQVTRRWDVSEVRVGDLAPDATLVGWDRQPVSLRSLTGQPLVLAFFPAAFTQTCTREMCTFRDALAQFNQLRAKVVGISVDLPFALKAFAEQLSLNFPLLSDYGREAVRAFGVEDPRPFGGVFPGLARRAVFVLDPEGRVVYRWVSEDPKVEPPYEEVQAAAAGLRQPGAAR
jgi:peroxiredoxin